MGTITSANALLTLQIATLFPVPQQLQQFATDDIYGIENVKQVETRMGVDGVLSGGFVWVERVQNIHLQANSPSNSIFDTWAAQQEAASEVYQAQGVIQLPSVKSKFIMLTGFLTGYSPAPAAKKILEARTFQITWGRVAPMPAV